MNLKKGTPANQDIISKKFRFYDSLFLDVLQRKNELGPSLFNIMYSKYPVQKIFSYLDEQTSFAEDLDIMVGFPWPPFLHSFVKYSTR